MVKNTEKKLYKIGYVIKFLGITARTVRYYEQMGLLPHIKRSDGKMRLFDDSDLALIKKIRRMQSEEFLPLEIIRDRIFGSKKDQPNRTLVVVTDSAASISEDSIKKLNVQVLPFKIQAKKELVDYKDITSNSYMAKIAKYKDMPKNVAPTVDEFEALFLELKEKGYKKIFSLHSSSKIVAAYDNAVRAANRVVGKIDVTVVDSKTIGAGLCAFVCQVAEAINGHNSEHEIELLIEKQVPILHSLIYANDLRALLAGIALKDIENQTNLMKKLMGFKPIMMIDGDRGEIEVLELCKETEVALERILEKIDEEVESQRGYINRICIVYNIMYVEAMDIANKLKQRYPNTKVDVFEGSSALSLLIGDRSINIAIA
jgi:DegV family protein with EDD domain